MTVQTLPLDDTAVRRIRSDFPELGALVNGKPLVYLDSGATSLKPTNVLDAERWFAENFTAAVHRGAHTLAAEATEQFERARESVAAFVGADADEIVWTSNATEGLNLVAYAIGNATAGRGGAASAQFRLEPGDEIVVTESEHHANLIPWQELAARTGAVVRAIPVDDSGQVTLEAAAEVIGERTRIVAIAHVSNVTAAIAPVDGLVRLARAVGAFVVLDACQSVPHMPVDLHALDVDFAVFSGHKMLAPTGIGVLYGRRDLLNALPPFLTGGSMITTVTLESAEYLPAPQRFEAGTQRISQAIALAAACDYLSVVGLDRIAAHEHELGARLVDGLQQIDGVRLLGPTDAVARTGLAAFDLEGVHAHDAGQFLDDRGIAVRVGHHCAQPLHRRFGMTASTRASTYLYNTTDDVDAFLDALSGVRSFFGVSA
ncbi:aminotransferase class V-fold PLP-dependent enzyme [Microbacterium sp. MPKO10]|uniref:aminotransferase class V-fold PLP-dependent enzyme n=1 Tax=Microbacterium sp. MPKO10 TaxID=2989818 RepID=UPI002235C008|nr:SufS family cysteine desulfurase [Microbacterium sp. MPKO10]MCW4456810.1 SufS family cysteine desulfurase [Microbacterium sp. MPKO10]